MNIPSKTRHRSRASYEDLSPASQKAAIFNLLNSNYYADVVCGLVEYDIKSRLIADYPVKLVDVKVAQVSVKSDARLYKVEVSIEARERDKIVKIFKATENMIPIESSFRKHLSLDDFSRPDDVFLVGEFSSDSDEEPSINIGYHKDDFSVAERFVEPLQDWFADVCYTISNAMRFHVENYFCDKSAEFLILDKDLQFHEDGSLIVPSGYKKELSVPY